MWLPGAESALPHGADENQLVCAADDRRPPSALAVRPYQGLDDQPSRYRFALAFHGEWRKGFIAECILREPVGLGSYDHPSRSGQRLQASGCIDDIASGDGALGGGIDLDDRFARTDSDPHVEIESRMGGVQLADTFQNAEGGADGALCVVATHQRNAEYRHDGVAGVLLERPAVLLDSRSRLLVVEAVPIANILRIGPTGAQRRRDLVHEKDRNKLPLFTRMRAR